ncbi:PstS family phosphate ABC transporter substrate-binding protein [Streptomyces sp. NPDC057617]|uniref:PstS family phosphate ABC transporter substrate-binding protein n=1 Tax=unclassified Streptomyces TaxID=2593676 RepID=UPI003690590E
MESFSGWLSAENVIAVVTAVLGIAASLGVLWYERRVPRRTRIGYRVQLDTPVSSAERSGRAGVRLGLFQENRQLSELSDATLVLLRIENDGSQSIAGDDYTGRELHGLTAEFTSRTIRGIAVTTPLNADHLLDHFTPAAGLRYTDDTVFLPRVPLNRGVHFKLLVLLTGGTVGDPVRVSGGIRDGGVFPNRSTTPDDTPPLFSRASRLITVLLTVSVVALASIVVVRDDTRPPMGCAQGELTITGSTAFKPVADELAEKYEHDCAGSTVTVEARSSGEGLQELDERGAAAKGGSPALIALSDVRRTEKQTELQPSRVAVAVYTLVVHDDVPVSDLTTDEVKAIYRGDIRRWNQLRDVPDDYDLPIVLASRKSGSGTRDIFESTVLGGDIEEAYSSPDCETKIDPSAKVFRCELDSTARVLAKVAATPGAIGYTELRSGSTAKGVHTLSLDGQVPLPDTIAHSDYPYRGVEYAYTYGSPPTGSLVSSFLNFLLRGGGQEVVRKHGHVPCSSAEAQPICAADPAGPADRAR